MKRGMGVVTGTVKSLEDPDEMGRVQVTYHWMSEEEPTSNWARISVPMGGAERGVQFMPEIGDEVLVAFEHGDQRFPYIIGFLWNGEDKPPSSDPKKRTIKTVSGHTLEFDDTEDSEKISILFKGDKPGVVLDEKTMTIETASGHTLTMDDDGSIDLKFGGGDPSIVLEQDKITIAANGSNSIEVTTSGITIKGTTVKIEGNTIELN